MSTPSITLAEASAELRINSVNLRKLPCLNAYLENAIETFLCFFFVQFRAKDKQKSMSKDDLMDNPGSPYIDVEALSDEDNLGRVVPGWQIERSNKAGLKHRTG